MEIAFFLLVKPVLYNLELIQDGLQKQAFLAQSPVIMEFLEILLMVQSKAVDIQAAKILYVAAKMGHVIFLMDKHAQ